MVEGSGAGALSALSQQTRRRRPGGCPGLGGECCYAVIPIPLLDRSNSARTVVRDGMAFAGGATAMDITRQSGRG